jgi:hypothetical protein
MEKEKIIEKIQSYVTREDTVINNELTPKKVERKQM